MRPHSAVPPTPERGCTAKSDSGDDSVRSEGDEALDEWLEKRARAVERTREEARRAREAKEAEALAACTFAPTFCGCSRCRALRDDARRDARAWQASEEEG